MTGHTWLPDAMISVSVPFAMRVSRYRSDRWIPVVATTLTMEPSDPYTFEPTTRSPMRTRPSGVGIGVSTSSALPVPWQDATTVRLLLETDSEISFCLLHRCTPRTSLAHLTGSCAHPACCAWLRRASATEDATSLSALLMAQPPLHRTSISLCSMIGQQKRQRRHPGHGNF